MTSGNSWLRMNIKRRRLTYLFLVLLAVTLLLASWTKISPIWKYSPTRSSKMKRKKKTRKFCGPKSSLINQKLMYHSQNLSTILIQKFLEKNKRFSHLSRKLSREATGLIWIHLFTTGFQNLPKILILCPWLTSNHCSSKSNLTVNLSSASQTQQPNKLPSYRRLALLKVYWTLHQTWIKSL